MGSFDRELLTHRDSLLAYGVSLTRRHNTAEDLVQETMIKAWKKQESFEPGTNMKAWLFTILRNEFYSQMRKRGREIQDTDGAFTERMSVHASQHGHMDMLDLNAAIALLPIDQQKAIMMVGASGFEYEEAAKKAGCAVGTMKSRVSRARTMLKKLLEDYEPSTSGRKRTGTYAPRKMQRIPKEPRQPYVVFFRRKPVVKTVPKPAPISVPSLVSANVVQTHPELRPELLLLCGMQFSPLERVQLSAGTEARIYALVP